MVNYQAFSVTVCSTPHIFALPVYAPVRVEYALVMVTLENALA